MAKLGQPGLTVPQKQEVQARWVAGESNEAIAAALGRSGCLRWRHCPGPSRRCRPSSAAAAAGDVPCPVS